MITLTQLLKEISDEKVKELISKLNHWKTEFKKQNKDTFVNALDDCIKLINQYKFQEAFDIFIKNELNFEIGTTYTLLKDLKTELYIETHLDKNWGLKAGKYIAYRCGDLNSKRGIFFSIDYSGAKLYCSDVHKYEVTIHKPLIAARVEYALSELTNKSIDDILKIRDKAKVVNEWWMKVDKTVMELAKKKGYDSIIYTNPAPPAVKEMVIFDKKQIKKIE